MTHEDITFTFVVPSEVGGACRVPFNPRATVPDWRAGGRQTDLLTLYHRDCDENPRAWIEGVDGEYVRPPRA